MSDGNQELQRESILLRILWMVIFTIVWQLAEILWAPWCCCNQVIACSTVRQTPVCWFWRQPEPVPGADWPLGTFNSDENPGRSPTGQPRRHCRAKAAQHPAGRAPGA